MADNKNFSFAISNQLNLIERRENADRRSGTKDRRQNPDRRSGLKDRRKPHSQNDREELRKDQPDRRSGENDRRVNPDRRTGLKERRMLPDRRNGYNNLVANFRARYT